MPPPVEIVFHNLDRSPAVEAAVRERVAKLGRFAENILSCRVTVEAPHKSHQQGNLYTVRVDLHFPGGEAVVNRTASENHSHEDVYVALRDAFKAARRQLQDQQRIRALSMFFQQRRECDSNRNVMYAKSEYQLKVYLPGRICCNTINRQTLEK